MSSSTLHPATLSQALWRSAEDSPYRSALLVLFGALVLTLSAKLTIPFWPVPFTMQNFALLALAMAYGWRLALATVAAYLLAGAAGFPVFAGTPEKGVGLIYMAGPTGGYLLGFLFAAMVCGWLAERGWDRSAATTAAAMLIGNAAIYVPGLLWLGVVVGWDKPLLELGLTPFLAGDAVKVILAAGLLPWAWRLVSPRRKDKT